MATQPTAAIYNRWLRTLGGGEQTTFAIYETLKKMGYETRLISPTQVDTQLIQQRFGVKLDADDMLIWPNCSNDSISQLSRRFDLFVNASHFDYPVNQAKKGILCIYFPAQLDVTGTEYLKRKIVIPLLQKQLRFVDFQQHQHSADPQRFSYIFNSRPQRATLSITCQQFATSVIDQIRFLADGQLVTWDERRVLHHHNRIDYFFEQLPSTQLTVELPLSPYAQNLTLQWWIDDWRWVAHQLFQRFFPKWELRLHGGPEWFESRNLESYHHLIANSQFTQHWIQQYWQKESMVLYPPVSLLNADDKPKKKWIAHVGRFFATGHNKKQLELIQAFRQLVDSGVADWQLQLIGSVETGEIHAAYVKECQQLAKGYPVFFHFGVPAVELKNILAQSALYWHATGFDIDEQQQPAFLEHFGMTVVEAMSAGCVPVVINKGGIPEIVTEESGVVWKTIPELIEQTQQLIHDSPRRKSLSQGAIKRAKVFSKQKFQQQFEELVKEKQK